MFWDDIKLVTEQVEKYGLRKRFVDLGGCERPCIADYDLTIATGDQGARYLTLSQRPFDHIDPDYLVLNPEKGDPSIEDLPYSYPNDFGTAVCLNVIEHVENPFRVFNALYQTMKPDGLLIVGTVFSFPYHPSPRDYWRYSPECLQLLAESAGFRVLECDWRNVITADRGVRTTTPGNDEPQEIRSVYATMTRSDRPLSGTGARFPLPERHSTNPAAREILLGNRAAGQENTLQKQLAALITDEELRKLLARHALLPDEAMLRSSCEMMTSTLEAAELVSQEQLHELLLGGYYADVGQKLQRLASQLFSKAESRKRGARR